MNQELSQRKIKPIHLILIIVGFVSVGYLTIEFLSSENETEQTEVKKQEETTSEEVDDEIYMITEVMPEFEGGNKGLQLFIANNVVYPPEAKDKNITGRVFITFVVNQRGKVTDVEVLKGVHPLLDEAAIQCIKSLPDFTPGMQDNKPAKVRYNIPINFQLR